MIKDKSKTIVSIAEKTVKELAEEWKRNPYLWDSEADIHGELYARIKEALKKFGMVKGHYKRYMNHDAYFNRIYCKPLTYIAGGERYYPDIVIYDNSRFNNSEESNELMLWVCEIKYKTQWGGDQSEENRTYDKEKLRRLLRQCTNPKINGTKYAYFLELVRTKESAMYKYGRISI